MADRFVVWATASISSCLLFLQFMLYLEFDLRPGQTHATLELDILQHCCAQRVTRVWPPCSNMLQDVGWCWIKFENGQIFVTFLDVFGCWRSCARLASSFISQHDPTMLQDAALKRCVDSAGPLNKEICYMKDVTDVNTGVQWDSCAQKQARYFH